MSKKVEILDLDAYADLFKDGKEGLDAFLKALEEVRAKDPEGVVHIMDGNRPICDINFKIPKWAAKLLANKHRPIDAEWRPQIDELSEE